MEKVADMTVEELKLLIRQTVQEALYELTHDPDEGLALKPDLAAYLTQVIDDERAGKTRELFTHEQVLKELGLDG